MTSVRDVMSSSLVTVDPATTVAEAATIMAERHVGSALVVGEGLLGIFTERDIVRALSQDFDAPRDPVTQWMSRNPVTIGADATAEEALDEMLRRGFRHLPVLDEDQVVGVVSMRDLSRIAAES